VLRTHTSPVQARALLERARADLHRLPGRVFPHGRARRHAHRRPSTRSRASPSTRASRWPTSRAPSTDFAAACSVRASHAPAPVLLPVHRAERRDGPALLRVPRRGPGLPHLQGHRLDRVGRLRDGQPNVLDARAASTRDLFGLCLRHGHRPGADVPHGGLDMRDMIEGDVRFSRAVRDGDLMRVPVDWLRELRRRSRRAFAGGTSPRTSSGSGSRRRACTEGNSRGPLVVGRVLSKVPEPQKNGKTINWCMSTSAPTANGPRRAAGNRVRRPQLRRR
jgi:hypothetical protein